MVRVAVVALAMALAPACARANDWERFYQPVFGEAGTIASPAPVVSAPPSGDMTRDVDSMFRKGYVLEGYSSFSTGNGKSSDAIKWGNKLKARYVIIITELTSSEVNTMPLTLPTTSTTVSNGSVNAYGAGGSVSGNYSGTSTTYGSKTTYIPIRTNRFDKVALYFREVPKSGAGFQGRDLSDSEMQAAGTRRAIAVQFVRDGSPAYLADLLPGDLIVMVNGQPADRDTWQRMIRTERDLKLGIWRAGVRREVAMHIPDEWVPAN